MIRTPLADQIVQGFTFKAESGAPMDFKPGHREIMECILARKAPDGKRRIQIIAHTRYGKSEATGAAVAVRVATKPEKWAIVAGTTEKARIIMDYAIRHILDNPILRTQLDIGDESLERLRRERSKDRLTFKSRGELRVFSADSRNRQQLGNALMGFGAPNVIEDESALIDDDVHSKVMRMLGDDAANNFLLKIGNPFNRNHFLQSWQSDRYYKIFIDYHRGLIEGRMTQDFIDEMQEQANFDVFYACKFPDADAIDSKGWVPLLTDEDVERAFVENAPMFGQLRLGVDVAGGGRNFSTGILRSTNAARIALKEREPNTLAYAAKVSTASKVLHVDGTEVSVDKVGIGRGCAEILHSEIGAQGINAGDPPEDAEQFVNLRAEMYWRVREWILKGGKLIATSDHDKDDWMQLTKLKYRTILEGRRGKLQIISKEELLRQGIESPDVADGLSLTFARRDIPGYLGGESGVIEPQAEEPVDRFSILPD